jgi:hypothetical protein
VDKAGVKLQTLRTAGCRQIARLDLKVMALSKKIAWRPKKSNNYLLLTETLGFQCDD